MWLSLDRAFVHVIYRNLLKAGCLVIKVGQGHHNSKAMYLKSRIVVANILSQQSDRLFLESATIIKA